MASLHEWLELNPDEFAFYFSGDNGVSAGDLGKFLERAATIARRRGAEIRVVGLKPGSLAVILKTFAKPTAKSARKEFEKAPIATTAAGTALVGAVVGSIIMAMNAINPTPLARSGAEVIEGSSISQIEIVSIHQQTIIMDSASAAEVREVLRMREERQAVLPSYETLRLVAPDVKKMTAEIEQGTLSGSVAPFEGVLHFRPDGYRYFVPIDLQGADSAIMSAGRFRVKGQLRLKDNQPDEFQIFTFEKL